MSTFARRRYRPTLMPFPQVASRSITNTNIKDGYTNKNNFLGSWIGREGKGGQAWLTDWLSPKEYIQLGYRNAKVSKSFIPGGTTQNDINIKAVLRLKENLELNAFGQVEFWKVPVLASGQQHDFTGSFQLTYFPKLSWHR